MLCVFFFPFGGVFFSCCWVSSSFVCLCVFGSWFQIMRLCLLFFGCVFIVGCFVVVFGYAQVQRFCVVCLLSHVYVIVHSVGFGAFLF